MSKYVDGFVIVIPKSKAEEYKKMAEMGRDAWMKHGALDYKECRNDDLVQHDMGGEKSRDFREMTGAGSDDDVWFSFITFASKAHRDEVNAKVMEEMSKQPDQNMNMPFEMKKMAYGGFAVDVEG